MVHPGLPELEFRDLFTMCRRCRWVMTRETFRYHQCDPREAEVGKDVIDLTVDP